MKKESKVHMASKKKAGAAQGNHKKHSNKERGTWHDGGGSPGSGDKSLADIATGKGDILSSGG